MEPAMSTVTHDFVPAESCAVPEWFAIHVMPRHEKRIAEHLQGLSDQTFRTVGKAIAAELAPKSKQS